MINDNAKKHYLTKFRECYLNFAKAILAETNKNYVAEEIPLLSPIRFKNKRFIYPGAILEQFIPTKEDSEFPNDLAIKCAELYYKSGLDLDFELVDKNFVPVLNPPFKRLQPIIVRKIILPIKMLVIEHNKTSFSRRKILNYLDKYIAKWQGEGSTEPKYAPLLNFGTVIKSISLDEYVSIVPLRNADKIQIYNKLGLWHDNMDIYSHYDASHVIKLKSINRTQGENTIEEINKHSRKVLAYAITAFRLLKPGYVGTLGYIHRPTLLDILEGRNEPQKDLELPVFKNFSFYQYTLKRPDLNRFRKLYNKLSTNQFEKLELLQLPLRHFNRSCQRDNNEDQILDYMICLESTLLSGVREELSYRLSLRAAKLLCNKRNPEETFKHLRCLYQVRSLIVHEGYSLGSEKVNKEIEKIDITPEKFMSSIELLIREILAEIVLRVSKQHTFNDLGKELDQEIIHSI